MLPAVVLAATLPLAADDAGPRIFLSIEPVLVHGSDILPLNAPSSELILVNDWGAHYQNIRLGTDKQLLMYYKLEFKVESPDTLRLKLERFPQGPGAQSMPVIEETISVLDAWRATLLERTGDGGRIELRVTPVIRGAVDDEPFGAGRLKMHFDGGPLIVHGENAPDDRVVFREVNVGAARGLRLGVSGVGTIKLSIDRFEGSSECGWVRGFRLYCKLGDTAFGLWSTTQIMPEDPLRPGKGWVLYGELEPDPSMGYLDGFYGSFEP